MKLTEKLTGTRLYKKAFPSRYCLLAGLCTAIIMTVVYFCYDLAPFGDITILRMDLYHQYGPLFAELSEKVSNLDSLLYSWKSGGGGGFLGNFYNYLSSPTLVIMLLFGHDNMPEAISAMIFVKAVLASFTFSYFLTKKYNNHSPLTSAFGVLYACSGFFIAYYWNVMWLDALYLLPLVILGIERIIDTGKMKLYVISLAVTLFANYYMGYMVCIFAVIYFIYYYFSTYDFADTYFGSLGKRPKGIKAKAGYIVNSLRNSRFFDSGVRFAFASLGGALLVGFSLIPVYFALKNCSATSGTFPAEFKTYFSIFDFLANHLSYLDPTIRSSGEDVLPNVYCGVLTVMLVPLYIFSNRIKLKEKVLSISLLGILFASFYTNYLNYIWHGFHFPNDLPYRFSFIYSFVLLVLAFKVILNIKEFTSRQIIGVGVATVAFVILVQEIGSKNFSETGVWISLAFIGIYCLALGILKNDKYPYIAAASLVLCSCCAEYTVANTNNYSMDQPKKNFVGDYEDFCEVKQEIDDYEGNQHYRMELTTLRARMDPCWYYYNGVSTFSSMAYEKVANMHSNLGMYSNYINSYTYNRQTPVYNAFFALDYIVKNDYSEVEMNPELYKEIAQVDKYTAYENLYQLPIAFRVNEDILQWSHDNTNPFEVQSGLFEASTGINNVYTDMEMTSVSGNGIECNDLTYSEDGYFPYTITDENSPSVNFEYTVKESGNAYLYFKDSGNKVDSITITCPDGTIVTQTVDTKPYILDLSMAKSGDVFDIYIPHNAESTDGYFSLYAVTLNDAAFQKGYKQLKKDSLDVTSFEDTVIKGTIDVSADGVLYTSVNYDAGWSVYIDDEKVSQDKIHALGNGALLGIDIEKGEHTVTFKYVPQGLYLGISVSVVTIILFLLLAAIIKTGYFKFCPVIYTEEKENDEDGILEVLNLDNSAEEATELSAEDIYENEADSSQEPPSEETC